MISCTILSPNNSGERTHKIDRITPHCVVGQLTAEAIGSMFKNPDAKVSSNYGIGKDGKIGLYVPESMRSWCSSNRDNDQQAVTIECASDKNDPYTMNSTVYSTLIKLCVDVCKRNGKTKLLWFNDRDETLKYKPAKDEMVLTVHRWFANKACPGDWLYSRLGSLASEVTAQISSKDTTTKQPAKKGNTYTVQVGAFSLKPNAQLMKRKLQNAGFDTIVKQDGKLYTVQVGAFTAKKNAEAMVKKLKAAGFAAIIKNK